MNLKILWLIVAGGCAAAFGSGLLIGRQFPAHRFEKFGNTSYLLETSTGKVCNPFKDPKTNPVDAAVSANPFTHAFDPSSAPKDANGFPIVQSSYPPACGK